MNKEERQALWSFIAIYTLSSVILMAIIALLYYNKELDAQKRSCKNDLSRAIMSVEMHLLKADMDDRGFIFRPNNYNLQVGLFNNLGSKVFSNLNYNDVDLNTVMSLKKKRIQKVKKLKEPIQSIKYIVAEDSSMPQNIDQLKYLIYLTIFISSIFIAFTGYLLSKLLLKPINNKIKQIDHFIKDSAHEINTPVTALLMSVSALKKKNIPEEKLLRHISSSSKQISEVFNTLSHVAFDDIKSLEKSVNFDLKKEILKSIAFYGEIADAKNINIKHNLSSTYINMDKDSAYKLINNLLSNAIKYSNFGKEVTVTLKNNKLSVKDQGIGISYENQKTILHRYKRATSHAGGFGIGLDIVNSICNKYDIKLILESKLKYGTLFNLDFSKVTA